MSQTVSLYDLVLLVVVFSAVQVVLLSVIAVSLHPKARALRGTGPVDTPAPLPQARSLEHKILKRVGEQWVEYVSRPEGHPDLQEAYDTRGLAIRKPDGSIELGNQEAKLRR